MARERLADKDILAAWLHILCPNDLEVKAAEQARSSMPEASFVLAAVAGQSIALRITLIS